MTVVRFLHPKKDGKPYLLDLVQHTGPSGRTRWVKRVRPDGHMAKAGEILRALHGAERQLLRGEIILERKDE